MRYFKVKSQWLGLSQGFIGATIRLFEGHQFDMPALWDQPLCTCSAEASCVHQTLMFGKHCYDIHVVFASSIA